jgi:hypothetical protein
MKRIYHKWELWEDYKNGFYNNVSKKDKGVLINNVIEMFSCEKLTDKYMNRVINEWVFSCEQNLTNESMNKIAYIGQAAACLYCGASNTVTMYSWKLLTNEIRERADKIASKKIIQWKRNRILKNTLEIGREKGMKKEYQMKLQLN